MRNIFTPLFLIIFINAVAQQDGTLDGTWTNGGKVLNPIPGPPANPIDATVLQKLIILPSGKFLQTFTKSNGTDNDFGLARLNADGSFDLTFGGSGTGYILTNFGGEDVANSMALQSDGKIIVVGTSTVAGSGRFALARFNTNGTLDNTFGTSGKTAVALGNDDLGYAVAIRPDNKILVGGSSSNGFVYRYTIAQYTANGNLDAGNFNGGNGFMTSTFGNPQSAIQAITLKSDGTIVTAGYTFDNTDFDFALAQYTTTGFLDGSFGGGSGFVITDFGSGRDEKAYDVKLTSTGKIIAAGYTDNGIGATVNNDFALAQYTSTGVLDVANFGSGGKVVTDFGANETGFSLGMQSDTRIILFGMKGSGPGITDNDFAIARYLSNGLLDPSFGGSSNGTNTVDFGSDDRGYSVALGSNYIMTSGISSLGVDLALARLVNTDVALPVTLSTFTATRQSNSVVLNWQTVNEQDAETFVVERSSDGIRFNSIGSVQASHNSQTTHNYSLLDGQPLSSVNFYRLRIVNTNGSFNYSEIVVVRFNSKSVLQAFPNPVRGILHLQVNSTAGNSELVISDVSGRIVNRMQIRSTGNSMSASIDMSKYQNGIYFIHFNEETIKIIKQ